MKKENISSAGTIVTSLLAASCCVGPAVFAIFGTSVGFLGKLTILDPVRPYLLTAAFVMFGYSFWKLYLKKTIPCACEADMRARRIARGIFWTGFAALIFAVSFPKIMVWLLG
jgi:mercuric ion transport protein